MGHWQGLHQTRDQFSQKRKVTSFFAIKDDMVNAGGEWTDEAVVIDKNLVTSRTPDDMPVFLPAIIDLLKK